MTIIRKHSSGDQAHDDFILLARLIEVPGGIMGPGQQLYVIGVIDERI